MANSDHLIGSLVLTVISLAAAEVARPLRFLNILLGLALFCHPVHLRGKHDGDHRQRRLRCRACRTQHPPWPDPGAVRILEPVGGVAK